MCLGREKALRGLRFFFFSDAFCLMSMSAAVLNLFVWDKLITGMFYVSGVDGTSKNDVSNVEWDGFGTCAKHMLGAREAGMCLSR